MSSDSSSNTQMDWKEMRGFVHSVIALFEASAPDMAALSDIRRLRSEIVEKVSGRESDARRVIQNLRERIDDLDEKASTIYPDIEKIQSNIQAVETEKAKLLGEIERIVSSRDASETSLHALTQQIAALKHADKTLMADHTATVPRVKYSLSLYATISHIRWDYDAPDGAIAGYLAPPDGAPVRPFHVDPRLNSPKEVADKLWGAIAGATAAAR